MRHWPDDLSVGFAATVVTNLSPLVGVWLLGWDADSLAFVYTVEVLFAILFAGVKALFAQQPPDYDNLESTEQTLDDMDGKAATGPSDLDRKRGGVRIVEWLPPVYPRNVPFAIKWFEATLIFAALLPAFLARIVDPLAEMVRPATVLCAVSLVVSHLVTASQQYIGQREYETVSPQGIARVPMQEAGVVLGIVATAGIGLSATEFVVASVVVKTVVACGQYRENGLFGYFTTPSADRSLRTVATLDAPVTEKIRPNSRAVLVSGLVQGAQKALGFAPFYLFLWLGLLILSDGSPPNVAGMTLLPFVIAPLIVATLEAIKYTLTHGWMSYQRRNGELVAYDELTDTPQWTTPVGEFRCAELSDGHLADRLFGSQTLTVTPISADDELLIAHIQSADRMVAVFELPLATTEHDSFRLRFAGVVATLAAATVAIEVSLPFTVADGRLRVVFLLLLPFVVPMTTFGFQKLWNRAY
jgi:hypothetical protein